MCVCMHVPAQNEDFLFGSPGYWASFIRSWLLVAVVLSLRGWDRGTLALAGPKADLRVGWLWRAGCSATLARSMEGPLQCRIPLARSGGWQDMSLWNLKMLMR